MKPDVYRVTQREDPVLVEQNGDFISPFIRAVYPSGETSTPEMRDAITDATELIAGLRAENAHQRAVMEAMAYRLAEYLYCPGKEADGCLGDKYHAPDCNDCVLAHFEAQVKGGSK